MSVVEFRQPRGRVSFQPRLVERLMAAVYRTEKLPAFLSREDMIQIAEGRVAKTGRRVGLVLDVGRCIYFEPDGSREWSEEAPSGGFVVQE